MGGVKMRVRLSGVGEGEGKVDVWVRCREEDAKPLRRWVTGLSSKESQKNIQT